MKLFNISEDVISAFVMYLSIATIRGDPKVYLIVNDKLYLTALSVDRLSESLIGKAVLASTPVDRFTKYGD